VGRQKCISTGGFTVIPNSKLIGRRAFVKSTAITGAGILVLPHISCSEEKGPKKKYAIVGVGIRSRMYMEAILKTYSKYAELVGFCDVNQGRLELAQTEAKQANGITVPVFKEEEFADMIRQTKPDVIIVTTVDGYHHRYIIRGMELGCDVITEKPMTIDSKKCQAIVDTQVKTGKTCTVTFNYRYSPPRTQVKDILMKGEIGDVLSVDFHWMLNTYHGADYFRRWHSQKRFSGGLMVHKATHHFDLVNWWLSTVPVSVMATGKREFYTPKMAKRFGLTSDHERCLTCPEKEKCSFLLELEKNRWLKKLYLDNEKYDGYFRDRCVFRPEIDIEDNMNVLVHYDNNVHMTYSLNAFNSWEGYRIIFNGTKGRIEHEIQESIYVSGTDTEQGGLKSGGITTRVIPLRGPAKEYDPWSGKGGHGGGDKILLDDLFLPEKQIDTYKRAADYRSGAYSILTGIAANRSMKTEKAVAITDLVRNIGYPDYTKMPGKETALPMP
jgi:predicted dehydrogenase